MPDITMCKGINCPIKKLCYRFWVKPSQFQWYFIEIPYDHNKHFCEHYWGRQPDKEVKWRIKNL